MYSPELMRFLLNYNSQDEKSSKKTYNFKDGNRIFAVKKLATVPVIVRNK